MDIPIKKIKDTLRLLVTSLKIIAPKAKEVTERGRSLNFPWIKGSNFKIASKRYPVRIFKILDAIFHTLITIGFSQAIIKVSSYD